MTGQPGRGEPGGLLRAAAGHSRRARRSTGAVAHIAHDLIFIVSHPDEWQVRPQQGGQLRSAPFGCVGGKLEPGEFPIDAVRREITEETSGSAWHVPGRTGRPYAFLGDGTGIAWVPRFGMRGMTVNPDWVIVEDDVGSAEVLLYGFAAVVTGDPVPSGGHPALLHVPWSLLPQFRAHGLRPVITGADILAAGGRIVPADAAEMLAGIGLFPIGTASFLCALADRSPRHPLLAELGLA